MRLGMRKDHVLIDGRGFEIQHDDPHFVIIKLGAGTPVPRAWLITRSERPVGSVVREAARELRARVLGRSTVDMPWMPAPAAVARLACAFEHEALEHARCAQHARVSSLRARALGSLPPEALPSLRGVRIEHDGARLRLQLDPGTHDVRRAERLALVPGICREDDAGSWSIRAVHANRIRHWLQLESRHAAAQRRALARTTGTEVSGPGELVPTVALAS